ncbi:MAG: carboxymethylenebutenolidase [Pseudonocardiales bacterium]|nr:carboxymethylenebutenolidase [Pseudonocardiales bacterium]
MPGMDDTIIAGTISINSRAGEPLEAYFARPGADVSGSRGGVAVIHHLPGYDRATKEITRRFAELGYDALMVNLYSREGIGVSPDDAAAAVRARGGLPDSQLISDIADVAQYLRALPTSNGKVASIGYCSGGRQSVLAACNVDLDAAVDCYGAFVTGNPPASFPVRTMTSIADQLPNLRAPLLGLFGNLDQGPSPAQVDELESILTALGKTFEFHRYDNAGHGFFATDREMYRVAAAVDGWERIEAFFKTYLGS